MYLQYWELTAHPFQNRLEEEWFYEGPVHEEALARILFLVEESRRFGLVNGKAGTGKTLLLEVLKGKILRTQRRMAIVDCLGLDRYQTLWQLAAEMRLLPSGSDSEISLWRRVQDHLQGLQQSHIPSIIAFDHVERAGTDCLRLIERLVQQANRFSPSLTFLVVSQKAKFPQCPSLLAGLSDLRIEIAPFDQRQTAQYIQYQMQRAGCHWEIFESQAIAAIQELTEGVPRNINRLCDLALLAAMAEDQRIVTESVIRSVADELHGEPDLREHSSLHRLG